MAENKSATDTADADVDGTDVDTADVDGTDVDGTDVDGTDAGEDAQDTVSRAELDKAIRARDKAKAELRKFREAQAAGETDKASEPDPADKFRTALVRTAVTAELAKAQIMDEDAVSTLIPILSGGLEVSEDGTVDMDTVTDTLDTLRRIFTPKDSGRPRTPRVDTRTKTDGGPADPDSARYKRIMGRR